MSEQRWMRWSERWSRLLLRLYPAHFREELGEEVVETYQDRFRAAWRRGGVASLLGVWLRAFADSLRNGLGERLRPSIAWRRMGDWGRDSERVLRRLARAPLFVAVIVGTLTVGLGAFAVVYAAVDKVLLEPLPYNTPGDLYFVWRDYTWLDLDRGALAGTDIAALKDAGGAIEDAVGLDRQTATLAGGAGSAPQEVAVMLSTPNLFEVLGVRPALGRGFAPGEAGPGRPPVVVLSHDLWAQRFGADPGIVGRDIRLDGKPFTVIGVMGRDFRFVQHASLGSPQGADLYTTLDVNLADTDPTAGSYSGLLRARPGSSPEAVTAAVARVGRVADERFFQRKGVRLYPVGMKADLVAHVRPALMALGLAGLLLVLVLMVNLATLLLARAAQREREYAISRALGADAGALVRATLLEGGVLGLLGGVGGALVAVWATRALVTLAPVDLPRREAIAVDWRVAAVVVAIGTLLGLLAGALPAAWATRTRLGSLLGATAVRGGGGHGRMRRGMVVVQVALALVLLCSGGLVVRSFERLLRTDPGFDSSDVLTFAVPITADRYPDEAAVTAVEDRIQVALAALPGVRSVGATSALPLTAEASQAEVSAPAAPGNTGDSDHDQPLIDYFLVRAGYFHAMGIRVLAGRVFARNHPGGVREAVIDRALAAHFFPTGNPIGATLLIGGDSLTVVGVVVQARQYDIHRDDRPQVYLRADDYALREPLWALRTDRSPLDLALEARDAIRRIDPQLAVADVRSMDQVVGESLRQQRVSAVLVSAFSLGALLLAAMGLFGVVAGAVTRRRHEIAIRMALGAERGSVLRLMVDEGMRLVLLGLLVGVPGIYLSARVLDGVLVGISAFDPVTLAAVASGLLVVALVACYLPARRVSAIQPAGLLRQE